jgi:hypothetical protein
LTDPVRYPADQLVALHHERLKIETAFLEFKSTILGSRVLRIWTVLGIEQVIYPLLITYQLLRTTISDATYVAGFGPDRGNFTIAVGAAKDQFILAGNRIDESATDLIGTIGAYVLAAPLPRRRLCVSTRGQTRHLEVPSPWRRRPHVQKRQTRNQHSVRRIPVTRTRRP